MPRTSASTAKAIGVLAAPGEFVSTSSEARVEHGGPDVKHTDAVLKYLFALLCCAGLVGCQTLTVPRTAPAPEPGETTVPSQGRATGVVDVELIQTAAERAEQKPETLNFAPPGEAEDMPPPPAGDDTLTLEELQCKAAASNPTLRQAIAFVEQARGNWLQVGLYPNPTVEAQRGPNNSPFDMFNVFVTQEIVTAGKLRLNRAVASHDVERAVWEAEAQKLRVFNEVQIRYVAALGAQRQVAVAQGLLEIAERGVTVSEQLLAGEEVSEADVQQARLQLNQTRIILRNAHFRADAAWKRLGNVVGEPNLPPRRLAGTLEVDVPDLDWEMSWRELIDQNPALKAARSRAEAARAQVSREQRQPTPSLHLTTGLGRDYFQPDYTMYTLQFAITPPVFNRNRGNIAAASAELRAATTEVDRMVLSLRDGLAEAFRRYRSSRNQARTFRETLLPMAEANLKLSLRRYEEGEFDFLRVLTARRDLFDANIKYVTAVTELRIAAIEIQGLLLTGGLAPVDSRPVPSNKAGGTSGPGD